MIENIEVSPAEARELLEAADATADSVRWRHHPVVSGGMAVGFAGLITTAAWETFGWVLGLLAVLTILLVVFRRQLFDYSVRTSPRQPPPQEGSLAGRWWLRTSWPLWMPVSLFLPTEPRWIGVLAGALAGGHLYRSLMSGGIFR